MFRSYLTIALRNLVRQKLYSCINIFGLAVGIAFCILTFLFVRHEWSFDRFHEYADRIYLVHYDYQSGDWKPTGSTPRILAPSLQEALPEIERAIRVFPLGIFSDQVVVRSEDRALLQGGIYAEPAFFEMFSFQSVAGDLKTALSDVQSVVVSKVMAGLFWGAEDPLGKRLSIKGTGGFEDYAVTGVVDVPQNSSIQFDFVVHAEKDLSRNPMPSSTSSSVSS